jgi:hypothetical protein
VPPIVKVVPEIVDSVDVPEEIIGYEGLIV